MKKHTARMHELTDVALNCALGIATMFFPACCTAQSPAPVGPVLIGGPPQNQMVVLPGSATFTVAAIGTAPITYQWNRNGLPISGATSSTYTTPATTSADNGAIFTVTVANTVNSFTSAPAILAVVAAPVPPFIAVQPAAASVSQGNSAFFYVLATGTSPISYQWSKNGAPIVGATSPTYTTPATTTPDNNAQFTVTATNSAGAITSAPATLVVTTVYGLGGFQPALQASAYDLTGIQYRFQVVANQSQSVKILFDSHTLTTPGSTISYSIETNVYSGTQTFASGGCTTWPELGAYTEGEASLRNATPDYNYAAGTQPAVGAFINTSDPIDWPIQTYLIDDISNLWKTDSISQFGMNGLETSVTIQQGELLTDISSFARCSVPMLSGSFRMWTITTRVSGRPEVVNQVVVPDADGRYIAPNAAMQFYSEFLNGPGTFTIQYWDFAYMTESKPVWTPVSSFITDWNYDGSGQDFGLRVVSVNGQSRGVNLSGQDRVEFSNVPGNSYLPGNLQFSIAPSALPSGPLLPGGRRFPTCRNETKGAVQTVFSDLGPSNSFSGNGWCVTGATSPSCGPAATRVIAAPFDPSSVLTLSNITFPLRYISGTNGATINLMVDSGGLPGAILESWSVSNLPSGLVLTSVSSKLNPVLYAGQTYWVEIQPLAADSSAYWFTNNLDLAGGITDISLGEWTALSGYSGQTLPVFSVTGFSCQENTR